MFGNTQDEYVICQGRTHDELSSEVNKKLKEGYKPHGSMVHDNKFHSYYQPMMKTATFNLK